MSRAFLCESHEISPPEYILAGMFGLDPDTPPEYILALKIFEGQKRRLTKCYHYAIIGCFVALMEVNMKTDRRKVVSGSKRVISVPNGLWLPQVRTSEERGRNHPHFDPWEDVCGAASFERACIVAFGPKFKVV